MRKTYDTDGNSEVVLSRQPCADCGSSDALHVYSDGHTYCFACQTHHQGTGDQQQQLPHKHSAGVIPYTDQTTAALKSRGITKDTCAKYRYAKSTNAAGAIIHIANYADAAGNIIGQKCRTAKKEFYTHGHIGDTFYGQQLFTNGKKLVVTEGEIDCLTVSQVQQNKYPVVSLPCGAASAKKVFQKQLEWLEGFEEVIVMFDMDEPGQHAVADVCGLLPPNKLKIATLPMKDPNACLLAGQPEAIITAIWNAKVYRPDGIVNALDLWDCINEPEVDGLSYPWETLPIQKMTRGMRMGELILLTAGTGIGKSTIARKIAYNLGTAQGIKVGLMMLEENKRRTMKDLMSDYAGKRLRFEWSELPEQERREIFEGTFGTGNFILYDHFGSIEGDNLIKKMRYMIAEGAQFIVLDHISIAVSGLKDGDERKVIDILMTQLRSLIEETGIGMLVISHLRKTEGGQKKTHEQGAAISLDQLRGSGTLKQIPDTIIAAERNQQSDDATEKHTMQLRVLKCRYTGETGLAGYLVYIPETDALQEATEPPINWGENEAKEEGKEGVDADCPF